MHAFGADQAAAYLRADHHQTGTGTRRGEHRHRQRQGGDPRRTAAQHLRPGQLRDLLRRRQRRPRFHGLCGHRSAKQHHSGTNGPHVRTSRPATMPRPHLHQHRGVRLLVRGGSRQDPRSGRLHDGPRNPTTGRSYKYFTSSEESMREIIEERVGIRTLFENDTRARCYAEYSCGKAKDENDMLYLIWAAVSPSASSWRANSTTARAASRANSATSPSSTTRRSAPAARKAAWKPRCRVSPSRRKSARSSRRASTPSCAKSTTARSRSTLTTSSPQRRTTTTSRSS